MTAPGRLRCHPREETALAGRGGGSRPSRPLQPPGPWAWRQLTTSGAGSRASGTDRRRTRLWRRGRRGLSRRESEARSAVKDSGCGCRPGRTPRPRPESASVPGRERSGRDTQGRSAGRPRGALGRGGRKRPGASASRGLKRQCP